MEEMTDLYGGGLVKNLSTYDFDINSSGKVSLKPHVYKDLTNKVGFIQFYAPWCGHCRNFVDEYTYLSELANRKLFLVGAYNSTQKDNEKVLQALNIEGFPTIKFFSIGGNGQVTLTNYTESRDPDAMLDYLCKNKDVCVAKKGGKKKVSPKKISGGCGCGLTGGAKKRRSPKKRTMKKSSPKKGGAKKSPKRKVAKKSAKKSPRRR
jgi:thiol-disulfide isomerase/thioredoxin